MPSIEAPIRDSLTAIQHAVALQSQGAVPEAEVLYRRILAIYPDHPDALSFLGVSLMGRGELAEAALVMDRALKLQPRNGTYWVNRGALYQLQQQPPAAEACVRRAIQLEPTCAGHKVNLAKVMAAGPRRAEALDLYEQALALDPSLPDAKAFTQLCQREGKPERALAHMERRAAEHPDQWEAWLDLAYARKNLEDEAGAMAALAAAEAGGAPEQQLLVARGSVLGRFWHHEEAIACFQRAIDLGVEGPGLRRNLATLLGDLDRFEETEDVLCEAIGLWPGDGQLHMQLGMHYLRHGYLEEGWAGLEGRPRGVPAFGFPEWQGEDVAGKKLLLVGEQGAGDHIQFVRFATALAERGAIVDVMTTPGLAHLCVTIPGVRRVVAGTPAELYDYWTLLMSAPLWLDTREEHLNQHVPYFSGDPAKVAPWRERIDAVAAGRRKVGLVWAGNPGHGRDRVRSMQLRDLAPLADVEGVAFFSLQKGSPEAQLEDAPFEITPLGQDFEDFSDTAAAMLALDLVITVDTSASHLAGALGLPVWVMLCAVPDWRWLLERSDSPWYPTARLFRQQTPMQWGPLVAEVAAALKELQA